MDKKMKLAGVKYVLKSQFTYWMDALENGPSSICDRTHNFSTKSYYFLHYLFTKIIQYYFVPDSMLNSKDMTIKNIKYCDCWKGGELFSHITVYKCKNFTMQ